MRNSSAESWNRTQRSESPGYWVRIRCASAIATFCGREAVLAVEDHAELQSSISTVAQEL
jgi:hypothetical protein